MKKYTALIASTLLIAAAIYAGGNFIEGNTAKVETQVLEKTQVEHKVTCTGRVESANTQKVYLPSNAEAEEVYVSLGDWVEEGEALMCVSRSLSSGSSQNEEQEASNQQIPQSLLDQLPSGITAQQAQEAYNSYLSGQNSVSTGTSAQGQNSDNTIGTEREEITAPISGVVSEMNLNEGSGGALVISDTDNLQVRLSVPESQISAIQVGQSVSINGVGFQDTTYHGVVESIANIAKQQVSTTGEETVVEVLVRVEDADSKMKSGFSAKCEITTAVDSDLLLAPYESVYAEENGQEYVYLNKEGKASKCYITTGREFEEGFEVLSGLQEGDEVIVSANFVKDQAWLVVNNKEGEEDV